MCDNNNTDDVTTTMMVPPPRPDYLGILYVATAGQNGPNLGTDEEEVVVLSLSIVQRDLKKVRLRLAVALNHSVRIKLVMEFEILKLELV